MTGAADDDPSGIGTYSQVGAAFGFRLLWTASISLPLAIAVQEATARLGLVTGEGLATLIRRHFPKPVLYAAVALVAVANTFNLGADLGSMGAATRLIVPLPRGPLIVAMTAVMLGLEVRVPYRRYSRFLRWLVLSLGAYVGVLVIVHVDWTGVLRHLVVPHVSRRPSELAALVAVFGTTISPYLFFWQCSEEVEEELEAGEAAGAVDQGHVGAMRVDVAAGMLSGVAVMFAIMVCSAATLGAHGLHSVQTAEQAAAALRPLAGRFAGLLFTAGIVGTGLLAVPVLAGSTAYAASEAFNWHEGLSRTFRQAPGFYGVIGAGMVAGLALNFAGVNAIHMLYLAAILNGLVAPPLLVLIFVLARSDDVLGTHRSGWLSQAGVLAAMAVMTIVPLAYVLS